MGSLEQDWGHQTVQGPGYGSDVNSLLQHDQVRNMTLLYKEASRQWKVWNNHTVAAATVDLTCRQQLTDFACRLAWARSRLL